jgi:predicted enzyme related to lactoylglutathione lyase
MPTRTRRFATPLIALLAAFPAALLPSRGHAAGEIYWFTLLSEDVYAAMDFYTGLFGWEIDSGPTGGFVALRNGQPFAGLNAISDRMPNVSESMWLAAITVDDIDESVAAARMLGATIHEDVTELSGWGTFALIQDPQGAPLVLVSNARPLGGTQGYSGWRWAELWTHDTTAAAAFYTQVIGYEIEQVPVGEATYTAFRSSGKRNAGLVQLDRPELAARWAPYVGVTDLRGILVRVWQERGKVLREPSEVDFEAAGENRVALIADPSGAMMFLYQLDENATPDPLVAADAMRGASVDPRAAPNDPSDGPNIHVSVSVGYGFGPGWGSGYPAYPYRYYGPRY